MTNQETESKHSPDHAAGRVVLSSDGVTTVTFDCICGDFHCYWFAHVNALNHVPAEQGT